MKPPALQKINAPKSSSVIAKYLNQIICGDSLKILYTIPSETVDCAITSPPYWLLRDYKVKGQIGLEDNFETYLDKLIAVFDEIKRVLKPAGTLWVNFGDTYSNKTKGGQKNHSQHNLFDEFSKRSVIPRLKTSSPVPPKSLCLIPERFAVKMIERGWILRNQIIWHKPNAMPQSVRDRFTVDFEKLFFFVKERKYYFKRQFEPLKNPDELKRRYSNPYENHRYRKFLGRDSKPLAKIIQSQKEILRRGRNKRCVWTIGNGLSKSDHFATFPAKLMETPILAGCPERGIVLDPFLGSGTTAVVARKLGRNFIGIELNPAYAKFARKRIKNQS